MYRFNLLLKVAHFVEYMYILHVDGSILKVIENKYFIFVEDKVEKSKI